MSELKLRPLKSRERWRARGTAFWEISGKLSTTRQTPVLSVLASCFESTGPLRAALANVRQFPVRKCNSKLPALGIHPAATPTARGR
jgi:hypothetical protein